jgi:hypothetical protein
MQISSSRQNNLMGQAISNRSLNCSCHFRKYPETGIRQECTVPLESCAVWKTKSVPDADWTEEFVEHIYPMAAA